MKAQDLRIKNIVNNSNGDPITLSIYNILFLWQWELQVRKYKGEPPFTPVPLTEEWLLKFGFEKDGNLYYHIKLGQLFLSRPYKEATHLLVKSNLGNQITSVKYVHQLQNLYHSLANEEPTIK